MAENEQSSVTAPSPASDDDSLEGPGATVEPDNNMPTENKAPLAAALVTDATATATNPAPPPKPPRRLRERFGRFGFSVYLLTFVFIVIIAVVVVVVAASKNNASNQSPAINSQNLTESELKQIAGSDVSVGNSNQVLNVASNAVFGGQVLVRKSLDVAGSLQVGSSLSLPNIKVSDVGNFGQVQAGRLSVSGNTAVQGTLAVNQSLTVSGSGSFGGSVTASKLNVGSLQLNGNLILGHHIEAGGPTPGRSTGSALGNGGTASVSGSDTAGTVNINTGSSPAAGCFITLTFAQAFNATPHIVVTPVGSTAGSLPYYINRSTTSLSICTASPAPGGRSFAFDYIAFD